MATLIFKRTKEYQNALRKIMICIDGEETGEIGNGETKSFEISPGKHNVIAKIDWCKSKEFKLDSLDNSTKTILISSNYPTYLALFSTTFGRNNYLKLTEIK